MQEQIFSKLIFVKDIGTNEAVRTSFLVKRKELFWNKNGKPYLSLTLCDKTGEIDARVWEEAENLNALFQDGDVVAVGGKANIFQNRLQFVVEHLVPLKGDDILLENYLPSSDVDLASLFNELTLVFENLTNPWVRQLGLTLLNDPDIKKRYLLCPAAKTIHHAYIGGLLVHSMQLIRLVDAILPLYQNIDRNLVIFGAAFHDFGKIYELSFDKKIGYTDEGRLVGHMAIAISLIDRKIQQIPDFPKELEWHLKHLILAHHGKLEYGSPKRPHTIEAEIVHLIDYMDSRIEGIQSFIKADKNDSRWTGYHQAYDQYYMKT